MKQPYVIVLAVLLFWLIGGQILSTYWGTVFDWSSWVTCAILGAVYLFYRYCLQPFDLPHHYPSRDLDQPEETDDLTDEP